MLIMWFFVNQQGAIFPLCVLFNIRVVQLIEKTAFLILFNLQWILELKINNWSTLKI